MLNIVMSGIESASIQPRPIKLRPDYINFLRKTNTAIQFSGSQISSSEVTKVFLVPTLVT